MKIKICEMLSIQLPIFAFSHCRDVVAEVSRAGGMGVLGVSGFTAQRLEQELTWIDEHVDGQPYAVDILIPNKYAAATRQGNVAPSCWQRISTFSSNSVMTPGWHHCLKAKSSAWSVSTRSA
ncbi:hypothetical protein [Pseudomonas sp. PDM31]|uniref:hypothetical protein n=1 Tax=Pseudomonas sp. PDM31 TaxID=2854778 RepID=UPI001C484B1A|nr:hypothetical protein [Pseudomonas sp. PDM31]MBV7477538.1 hypothetical protein [Pseudomonas sp. PDM31]